MPRPRLVDGGLGAERPSLLQVLPGLGFLVGQVEVGAGAVGDDLGAEGPGGPVLAALADGPAEDDVHLVRAADARGCRGSAARRRSARTAAGPWSWWWRTRSARPTAASGSRRPHRR